MSELLQFIMSITFAQAVYSLVLAALFVSFSYIAIRMASRAAREVALKKYGSETVAGLVERLSSILMWFFVVLLVLSLLGFSGMASSLGTASGLIGLGVAYALKDTISDTVAGFYLAGDKDFEVGDEVEVDSTTGEVKQVDLRKSRIELENGNTRVLNNSDVEREWTKKSG